MPVTDSEARREAIRAALAQRIGAASDGGAVADATLGLWQHMASQIEPVIGARGVDALFSRSLQLTGKSVPWLASSGVQGNSARSQTSVRACFEGRELSVAADAGHALLVTFAELLASLIGDSLTDRLLGLARVRPPESEQETRP